MTGPSKHEAQTDRNVPGEQNGHVMVDRVLVCLHVELLLPLTEAAQAVVSVMRDL